MHLRNHENFKKMKHKNFTQGGFCPGGFVLGGICPGVFCPRTISLYHNRKNDLILTMTPEKQDKTLELSKHWSADSTPARNEVIMKRTYPVKSVKCVKLDKRW